jgi:hypothetical protein
MFSRIGRWGTWYIPAALGLINVAAAPPELKMRKLFEEGFGVVGGAAGTMLGSTLVATGAVNLLALCGLCVGPFGLFVTVFICTSLVGIGGMELFKGFGGGLYNFFEPQVDTGQIYHSPEQFFLEAVK